MLIKKSYLKVFVCRYFLAGDVSNFLHVIPMTIRVTSFTSISFPCISKLIGHNFPSQQLCDFHPNTQQSGSNPTPIFFFPHSTEQNDHGRPNRSRARALSDGMAMLQNTTRSTSSTPLFSPTIRTGQLTRATHRSTTKSSRS